MNQKSLDPFPLLNLPQLPRRLIVSPFPLPIHFPESFRSQFEMAMSQSQHLANRAASRPSPSLSTSSKPFSTVPSTSNTATTTSSSCSSSPPSLPLPRTLTITDTTISLRLSASQAICPGNVLVSRTTRVFAVLNAVPHTPWPGRISWQAGFPWKGPRRRYGAEFSWEEEVVRRV